MVEDLNTEEPLDRFLARKSETGIQGKPFLRVDKTA